MLEGVYVAFFTCVDCADWNPIHCETLLHTDFDHLNFKFKSTFFAFQHSVHQPAADQPVARLVVGDILTKSPGERNSAQRVCQSPDKRHLAEIPHPYNQISWFGVVGV